MKKLFALLFSILLSVTVYQEASANETVSRLAGSSRYDTAVEISKEGWTDGADTVILARGDAYPDALAGVPLAKYLDAPILLTSPGSLHSATEREIKRLKPSVVIILGGKAAIHTSVEDEVEALDATVVRVSGKNRYTTSVEIAKLLAAPKEKAIIVTGRDFPDALSVAPFAAENGYPILLTDPANLPQQVEEHAAQYDSTLIVGGTAAVNSSIEESLPNPERISGKTRYETAAKVIEENYEENKHLYISTGENFADALTGSVLASKRQTAVMLVGSNTVPKNVEALFESQNVNNVTIFGGKAAVSDEAAKTLEAIVAKQQYTFTSYFPSQPRVSIFDREDPLDYDLIDYKTVKDGYYHLWFVWADDNHPAPADYYEDETGFYVVSNVSGEKSLMVEYPPKLGEKRTVAVEYAFGDRARTLESTVEVVEVTSDTFSYKATSGDTTATHTLKKGIGFAGPEYVDLEFPLTAEDAKKILSYGMTTVSAPIHFPEYDTEDYYCIGAEFYAEGNWQYYKVNKQTGQYEYMSI